MSRFHVSVLVLIELFAGLSAQELVPEQAARLKVEASDLARQGTALTQAGKPAEAVPLFEKALAIRQQLYPSTQFPAGHADLAVTHHNLSIALAQSGQPALAAVHAE